MTHPLDLTVDEPAVRGHVTAASVRREIIHALAGGGAMTAAQVRRAVAQALPSTERPSIAGQSAGATRRRLRHGAPARLAAAHVDRQRGSVGGGDHRARGDVVTRDLE